MALSEEELRLLEQMEAALAAEDPKLVNTLRGTGVRKVHRRRAAIAGVGFFVGLALLVTGLYLMSDGPIGYVALSLLGFAIMVTAAVTAIYSWQHVGAVAPSRGGDRPRAQQGSSSDGTFMDKMEERWRRRRDESGF
jgi:VIT1/CCC1 family predicted Fe2+/Mn2+ transporter